MVLLNKWQMKAGFAGLIMYIHILLLASNCLLTRDKETDYAVSTSKFHANTYFILRRDTDKYANTTIGSNQMAESLWIIKQPFPPLDRRS